MYRICALGIIAILALSCMIMVESSYAQTIPKPSVPNFSLSIIDNSYDVPSNTTSCTDPYTGKTTTQTQPGYHVTNRSIQVSIKNQPFTPYTNENGNLISLYYNISVKPHYGGNWTYYPQTYTETSYPASSSEYTVRFFGFGGYADTVSPQIGYVTPGGEVDFKVQAQIGYFTKVYISIGDSPFAGGLVPMFVGENSDWSNTRTIKIADESVSPSPSPTVPEFPSLIVIPLLLSLLFVALIVRKKQVSNRISKNML